jgi:hypothetical protein
MLFALWFGQPHRPTRDADFLGFGPSDPEQLADTIRRLCDIQADDGLCYETDSITVETIREEAKYDGLRATLRALLGNARCTVQWDVGFGDAVTPGPLEADYPVLRDDMPAPQLRVYPRETVFAEKLEAIAQLGIANTRMKAVPVASISGQEWAAGSGPPGGSDRNPYVHQFPERMTGPVQSSLFLLPFGGITNCPNLGRHYSALCRGQRLVAELILATWLSPRSPISWSSPFRRAHCSI